MTIFHRHFYYPEAATVGLTEEEARETHGDAIKV